MSEDETVTNCYALKPERSRTFLEIVVSYPAFCTYPEYEGKPYYAIKFEKNGETIVGFGTYKIEVLSQYLKDYFIPSAEPERTAKVETYTDDQQETWSVCECGTDVWKSYNYCPECGAKLDWSE